MESANAYCLGPSQVEVLGGVTVRINLDARRSVVFFGKASPPKGDIVYGGTGFLLCERGANIPYLITARHVAKQLEEDFVIRVNVRDNGSAKELDVAKVDWRYHPDPTVDLAATIYPLDANVYDVCYFNVNLVQPSLHGEVMCGDPVALVGLFRLHHGSKRNVTIVHSGNIAALPDLSEKVPVRDRTTGKIVETVSYLVEAQTLEGLSGSPVFIQKFQQIPGLKTPQGGGALGLGDWRILGIYQGAWDGEPGRILAADRNLSGTDLRVPVGMGIVVPGDRIFELIKNDPEIAKTREEVTQEQLRKRAASSDSAFSPPASDANPTHREDFTRLVGAAARKPAQED